MLEYFRAKRNYGATKITLNAVLGYNIDIFSMPELRLQHYIYMCFRRVPLFCLAFMKTCLSYCDLWSIYRRGG